MSGPQTLSPSGQSPAPEPSPRGAHSGSLDPLLKSGSFIHPEGAAEAAEAPEDEQPEDVQQQQFRMGEVIVAEPISVYDPSEDAAGTPPSRSSARRRNPEEMARRPSWLPEDWQMELRVRSSGASAGLIDRYYVAPSGQRKFRSKNEVLHFLETGSMLKRKSVSEADAAPPVSKEKKKSSPSSKETKPDTKLKKSEASTPDSGPQLQVPESIQADTAQEV